MPCSSECRSLHLYIHATQSSLMLSFRGQSLTIFLTPGGYWSFFHSCSMPFQECHINGIVHRVENRPIPPSSGVEGCSLGPHIPVLLLALFVDQKQKPSESSRCPQCIALRVRRWLPRAMREALAASVVRCPSSTRTKPSYTVKELQGGAMGGSRVGSWEDSRTMNPELHWKKF